MALKNLKNFCPLPFISLFTFNSGKIKICCDSDSIGSIKDTTLREAWNGEALREVRRAFLNDQRHRVCQKCWDKEDQGLLSARQTHEFNQSHMRDYDEWGFVQSFPRNLSLRLGNICNFKCIMCQPENSTKWLEDSAIYSKYVDDPKTKEIIDAVSFNEINSWLNSCDEGPRLIYFVGGEPLLSKDFRQTIQFLAASKHAKSIVIRVFSNLSVDPEWLLAYASFFERIEVCASVDGTEDYYNAIRFPGQWRDFDTRVDRLIQKAPTNLVFDFFFVVMSINIFNLNHFCHWVQSKNWQHLTPRIFTDILTDPNFLSIEHLPEGLKEEAADSLKDLRALPAGQRLIRDEIENIEIFLKNKKNQNVSFEAQKKLRQYLLELDAKRRIDTAFLLKPFERISDNNSHL